MATISPQTGFTLLLASTVWVEIHSLIEVHLVSRLGVRNTDQSISGLCRGEVGASFNHGRVRGLLC